jgi:hypothetical protein
MSYPKWPSEVMLRRKNREIISERLRWPDGALQACVALEDRHPGWQVSWMGESATPGFERPAGFHASYRDEDEVFHKPEAFAPTAEELEPLLVEVPEHDYRTGGCAWCFARLA